MGFLDRICFYLPKLIWVIIFLTFGVCFLILENNIFTSILGNILFLSFFVALFFWYRGASNRYKLWKNYMNGNNKSIKWHNWFRF